ncbi:hypothetical protein L207DRAFT_154596 [Hyaloscypha variabilis F]|uniref:Uncharacterized protein n=1 Tax=Hyaloscypha variabilis (strain UAMH 11265 / GT02V1 / F) TaxID=1149755 RepID=A0A2J6S982_HYAVF|nr:hypothetical protein L207DRAFT_154596 [Hyaloscypha variabilis F]
MPLLPLLPLMPLVPAFQKPDVSWWNSPRHHGRNLLALLAGSLTFSWLPPGFLCLPANGRAQLLLSLGPLQASLAADLDLSRPLQRQLKLLYRQGKARQSNATQCTLFFPGSEDSQTRRDQVFAHQDPAPSTDPTANFPITPSPSPSLPHSHSFLFFLYCLYRRLSRLSSACFRVGSISEILSSLLEHIQ